ncbi:hypothetical protein MSAN_00969400 [Mycena sanguinolenta]|uniref:Uncharacterized protein n=1 Tax=Mycena sanguinolenta TaxID=230812 RepID=A0A8H6YYJ9_9AGAR|nr:hypothetical protein MSAN_00969400 [Mycena sanguinolenta]
MRHRNACFWRLDIHVIAQRILTQALFLRMLPFRCCSKLLPLDTRSLNRPIAQLDIHTTTNSNFSPFRGTSARGAPPLCLSVDETNLSRALLTSHGVSLLYTAPLVRPFVPATKHLPYRFPRRPSGSHSSRHNRYNSQNVQFESVCNKIQWNGMNRMWVGQSLSVAASHGPAAAPTDVVARLALALHWPATSPPLLPLQPPISVHRRRSQVFASLHAYPFMRIDIDAEATTSPYQRSTRAHGS